MKKIESLFIGGILITTVVAVCALMWGRLTQNNVVSSDFQYPETKYGSFLAAQHAVYINDFDSATKYVAHLSDVDYKTVRGLRYMSEFLGGKLPEQVQRLKDEKTAPARIIYDAYLVTNENWSDLYKRHQKNTSMLSAPLRIWSNVATNHISDALKFIDELPTTDTWKDFVRGQIYAETGNIDKAATAFNRVRPEFMNISDYLYIMSFYVHNDMAAAADALRTDFTSTPGGVFMLEYNGVPDWSDISGLKNALAFSLVQNVSHTKIMMYSDMSLLWLRFAQIISPNFGGNGDAINYYIGQFMFNNAGDYAHYFSQIKPESPFYLFATMRLAEATDDIKNLRRIAGENPVFVPAVNKLVMHYIKTGHKRDALRLVNRALGDDNLPGVNRSFFLKMRAQINYAFGDFDAAQKDLHDATAMVLIDNDIIMLQAKIWAAQNREIENAYDYAMTLIRKNPTDIWAWDTLGRVVAAREGNSVALDLLSRVGAVSDNCSSLFDFLGDLYLTDGNIEMARDSYTRAIELANDGLVVVPNIEKKLRKLK